MSECDRTEAFQSLISQNSSTSVATFADSTTFRSRIETYGLGPGRVLNVAASGISLKRTRRHVGDMDACVIALAVPMTSRNHMAWGRETRTFGPGEMFLVDMSAPYDYGWNGPGDSFAFQMDADRLGVDMDTIRTACIHLDRSPIYPLVRHHIIGVTSSAEALSADDLAESVGTATVQLIRALILSSSGDTRAQKYAVEVTRAERVDA